MLRSTKKKRLPLGRTGDTPSVCAIRCALVRVASCSKRRWHGGDGLQQVEDPPIARLGPLEAQIADVHLVHADPT
jgi:hypothetical protein